MEEVNWVSKRKGTLPVDADGTLQIAPYWGAAMELAEKKRKKKIYLLDVLIIVAAMSMIYAGLEKYLP